MATRLPFHADAGQHQERLLRRSQHNPLSHQQRRYRRRQHNCGDIARRDGGLGLSRFKFTGSASLSFWILSTRMAPPVAFVVPMYILFRNFGLIDTHAALIVVYTSMNLSFVTWVLIGFFKDIPQELEEAALVDGYGYWQFFWKVAFPLVRP